MSRYFLKDIVNEITNMNKEVKAKVSKGTTNGRSQQASKSVIEQSRKKIPKRGKRHFPAMRGEILNFAAEKSVADASDKFDVSETTICEWIRFDKRRNPDAKSGQASTESEDSKLVRDQKILAMW